MNKGLKGRPWLTVAEAKPGAKVKFDNHFDCVPRRSKRIIQCNKEGDLFFDCREGGHLLDGQLSDDGTHYIGLYLVSAP